MLRYYNDISEERMEKKKEQLHKDHRSRLRKRYEENGLDSFEDHNVLELLLFYAIPRRDTNLIAHRLISKFGSLSGVFSASVEELQTVEGIGKSSAEYLALVRETGRRCMLDALSERPFTERERIGEYLVHWFSGKPRQTSCLLALDSEMFLKKVFTVNSGIELKPQSVTFAAEESALSSGFPKMIIAHNHSDGRMIPSAEDRVISRTLSERLRGHGIELCAHYIVSGMDYTEFDF